MTRRAKADVAISSRREHDARPSRIIAIVLQVASVGALTANPEYARADEVALPPPAARLSGRTEWGFDARHRQLDVRAGTLRLDVANDISLQTGVTLGLIPSVLVPRQDLSTRGALFLTLPGGEQRLLGVWKLRLSALGAAAHESTDTRTDLLGASFGMGPCLAPAYDTRGWVVLLCTEYGGGVLTLDSRRRDGARIASRTVGFGTVGLGVEAEYNFASIFQVGARLGWDVYLGEIEARREDGSRIFEASPNTLHAGVGLGLRF